MQLRVTSTRWQSRKLQTLFPPLVTLIKEYMYQFSVQEIQEQSQRLLHPTQVQTTTLKLVGKFVAHSSHSPSPCHSVTQLRGNSQFLLGKEKKRLDYFTNVLTFLWELPETGFCLASLITDGTQHTPDAWGPLSRELGGLLLLQRKSNTTDRPAQHSSVSLGGKRRVEHVSNMLAFQRAAQGTDRCFACLKALTGPGIF